MKDIIALAIAIGVAISLTACTTADAVSTDDGNSSNLTTENEKVVEGKVTKVNGNEVIIDVGEIKTAQKQMPEGETGGDIASKPEGETGGNIASKPEGETGGTASRPSGGKSGAPSGDLSKPDGISGVISMPAATTIELTGESMTIEVPVGTPVYMTVRGASSKVDFTRLSEDNLVRVKLNDDNKVLSVTVVS